MHEFILEDRYNIICNDISLTCLVWHNSDNNLMLTAFESGNNYAIGEPTIVATRTGVRQYNRILFH